MPVSGARHPEQRAYAPTVTSVMSMQYGLSSTSCTGFSSWDPSLEPIANVPPGISAMPDEHADATTGDCGAEGVATAVAVAATTGAGGVTTGTSTGGFDPAQRNPTRK